MLPFLFFYLTFISGISLLSMYHNHLQKNIGNSMDVDLCLYNSNSDTYL